MDVVEIGANAGAYFVRQPARGDPDPELRITVWADGLSRAEATPHVLVRGPRGTAP